MKHNRLTVAEFREMNGKRNFCMLYIETLDEAKAAAEVGIDILSIVDYSWSEEMRLAAGNCFVQVGLRYGEYITVEDYLRAAFKAINLGADCVYCAASLNIVSALAAEGIPVIGHLGLVPSNFTWTGGFKAVGKTAESAAALLRQAKNLEKAGAIGAELEVVPSRVAAQIKAHTKLILFGMGAGANMDTQYLFAEDVLGCTSGHKPRHAKTYANFTSEYKRLQKMRIDAFKSFKEDVLNSGYPSSEHSVTIDDQEYEDFLKIIQN